LKIKSYTLKFIQLGASKQIYLRYFITDQGKSKTLNINCNLALTSDQLALLNNGTLGGMIQKSCNQLKEKYQNIINVLYSRNDDSYPLPNQIEEHFNVTEKSVEIDYLINKYLLTLNCKAVTKRTYGYVLGQFKQCFDFTLHNQSIKQIISKNTINNFEGWLINMKYINQQDYENNLEDVETIKYSPISLHNDKHIVLKFLNYVAELYDIKPINMVMKQPHHSAKYHLSEEDMQKLLQYKPKNVYEADVIDILKLNKNIGLRISEILNIQKDNINILVDCIEIRFIESKKSKERTIIVIAPEGIEVIKKHILLEKLWIFKTYNLFDNVLKRIAKNVFGEETVKVYKINTAKSDYVDVFKSDAISSHAIRRYAIEHNIVQFGIDVARSYSGHTDYQVITRHYARFMDKKDLKEKLLKKN
jgi:integrase